MVAPTFVVGPWGKEAFLKRFAQRFDRPRGSRTGYGRAIAMNSLRCS